MKQIVPTKITRYIFALILGVFGLNHFMMAEDMAGMVPSFLPGGVIWVYLTGAAILAFTVAMLINKMGRLAGYLMALFLIIVVLTVHIPAMAEDPMRMAMVLKDLALAMACIAYGNMLE